MPFTNMFASSRLIRYRGVCERCGNEVSSFYADAMDDHLEQAHGIAYTPMSRAPFLRPVRR